MRAYSVRVAALVAIFAVTALLVRLTGNQTLERIGCTLGLVETETCAGQAYGLFLAGGPSAKVAADRFRTLVRQNPASPYSWATLAEALAEAGDPTGATSAMLEAIAAGPAIPQIRIRAANFFSAQGDRQAVVRNLAQVLSHTSAFDELVFDSLRRVDLPTREILKLLPADRRAAQAYFHDIRQNGAPEDLSLVWDWLLPFGNADPALAATYLRTLLDRRQYDRAHEDWIRYLTAAKLPGYEGPNLVYNPGFESEPSGSPFHWHLGTVEGASVSRDREVVRSGEWSLRVSFAGAANVDFHHASQLIVAKPGKYRLVAWIRTADLTTDQGIALRLFDTSIPARLDLTTARLTGTHDWTRVTLDFHIPPATRILTLCLVRTPSFKFDNKIAGTVWLDSVSLFPPSVPSSK